MHQAKASMGPGDAKLFSLPQPFRNDDSMSEFELWVEEQAEAVVIKVGGRFTFKKQRRFAECIRSLSPSEKPIQVDLHRVTFMDSAALGMLLLLREEVGNVTLSTVSPVARKVLKVANFDRIFSLPSANEEAA